MQLFAYKFSIFFTVVQKRSLKVSQKKYKKNGENDQNKGINKYNDDKLTRSDIFASLLNMSPLPKKNQGRCCEHSLITRISGISNSEDCLIYS